MRGLGQVDVARLVKDQDGWLIELIEVKSSLLGQAYLGQAQKIRLNRSGEFLGSLFGHRVRLIKKVGKLFLLQKK